MKPLQHFKSDQPLKSNHAIYFKESYDIQIYSLVNTQLLLYACRLVKLKNWFKI